MLSRHILHLHIKYFYQIIFVFVGILCLVFQSSNKQSFIGYYFTQSLASKQTKINLFLNLPSFTCIVVFL